MNQLTVAKLWNGGGKEIVFNNIGRCNYFLLSDLFLFSTLHVLGSKYESTPCLMYYLGQHKKTTSIWFNMIMTCSMNWSLDSSNTTGIYPDVHPLEVSPLKLS